MCLRSCIGRMPERAEYYPPTENDNFRTVTIHAGFETGSDPLTKTSVIINGDKTQFTPSWTDTDRLGVFTEIGGELKTNNSTFGIKTINNDGSAVFEGTLDMTVGEHNMYAYYPYHASEQGGIESVAINLNSKQSPTAASFDGSADILYAQPATVNIDGENAADISLRFARKSAMVAISFSSLEAAGVTDISKVELIVPESYRISGNRNLNLKTGEFTDGSAAGADNVITAEYQDAVPVSTMALLNVWPVTFKSGDNIVFRVTGSNGKTVGHTMTLGASNSFVEGQAAMIQVADWSDGYYSIGDYWPTDENPEGIVFSVSDGGLHGKIISLKEQKVQWGPEKSEKGADIAYMREEPEDGRLVTQQMIEHYKDNADFATVYPGFEWIYNTMNEGDIEGPWYVPSRPEIGEFAAAISGFDWSDIKAQGWKGTQDKTSDGTSFLMPGWFDSSASSARKAFKAKMEAKGDVFNIYGKFFTTWEVSAGDKAWAFAFSENNGEGGFMKVISKGTGDNGRFRPIRTFKFY